MGRGKKINRQGGNTLEFHFHVNYGCWSPGNSLVSKFGKENYCAYSFPELEGFIFTSDYFPFAGEPATCAS